MNLKMTAKNIGLMLYPINEYRIKGELPRLRRGAILYSVHFGTWELMPVLLQRIIKKNVGVLVERYTQTNPYIIGRLLDKFFYRWRSRKNIRIFYPDEIFKIIRFLKNDNIFAALIDGDTLYAKLEKIERLAQICGVPLIPFALYHKDGAYLMEFDCDLNRILNERPYDYWWFYRSRRQGIK